LRKIGKPVAQLKEEKSLGSDLLKELSHCDQAGTGAAVIVERVNLLSSLMGLNVLIVRFSQR
jgi:hypothetical protein